VVDVVVVVSAGRVVEQECGGSWGGGAQDAGGSSAVGRVSRTPACSARALFGTGDSQPFLLPALCQLMPQVERAGVPVSCLTLLLGSDSGWQRESLEGKTWLLIQRSWI